MTKASLVLHQLARIGLRSRYRSTVRKCSSCCIENAFNLPFQTCRWGGNGCGSCGRGTPAAVDPPARATSSVLPGPEMEVIRHQTPSENLNRQARAGPVDQLYERPIVLCLMVHLSAGITAVQHVITDLTDRSSCGPRHRLRLPQGHVGTTGNSLSIRPENQDLFLCP